MIPRGVYRNRGRRRGAVDGAIDDLLGGERVGWDVRADLGRTTERAARRNWPVTAGAEI